MVIPSQPTTELPLQHVFQLPVDDLLGKIEMKQNKQLLVQVTSKKQEKPGQKFYEQLLKCVIIRSQTTMIQKY